jgi:hypothetical protein
LDNPLEIPTGLCFYLIGQLIDARESNRFYPFWIEGREALSSEEVVIEEVAQLLFTVEPTKISEGILLRVS